METKHGECHKSLPSPLNVSAIQVMVYIRTCEAQGVWPRKQKFGINLKYVIISVTI